MIHYMFLVHKSRCKLFLFFALMGCCFFSCAHHDHTELEHNSTIKEGEKFTASICMQSGTETVLRAGVNGVEDIKSLRVLVFDADKRFLYSSDAVLETQVNISSKDDKDFLPDTTKEGITMGQSFRVSLVKSSECRYIHFVANYDWNDFSQDYFVVGTSAGELMTKLLDKYIEKDKVNSRNNDNKSFLAMWSLVELKQGLDENSLKDKVVKLLRDYAKITVKNEANDFTLEAFTVCNVPNQGAVVPFTSEHSGFSFPYPVVRATVPAATTLIENNKEADLIDVTSNKEGAFNLFEWDNTGDKKAFVVIKGKRNNSGESCYYKVDLVWSKDDNSIKDYFPILRNHHYVVNIKGVNGNGYKTIAEAIASPAGNNVFSSVVLQDFKKVSDGVVSLSVDPIHVIAVKAGDYPFVTSYTVKDKQEADVKKHMKYYPSWYQYGNKKDDNETGWVKDKDEYLEAIQQTDNGFKVKVKKVPTDKIVEHCIDVVGLRQHNNEKVDAVSGATQPIVRRVKIVLRPAFKFNGKLEKDPEDEFVRKLSFDISGELTKGNLPFDVYIKTKNLTPRHNDGDKKLQLVYRNGETYYRYTVRDEGELGKRIEFPFLLNDEVKESSKVELSSVYYDNQDIALEVSRIEYTSVQFYMMYKKPYEQQENYLRTSCSFSLKLDNKVYSETEFFHAFRGEISRESNQSFKMTLPRSRYNSIKDKDLTITATDTYVTREPRVSPGYVRYTLSATKRIQEWMQNGSESIHMDVEEVKVRGELKHFKKDWSKTSKPPIPTCKFFSEISGREFIFTNARIIDPEKRSDNTYHYEVIIPKEHLSYLNGELKFKYTKVVGTALYGRKDRYQYNQSLLHLEKESTCLIWAWWLQL